MVSYWIWLYWLNIFAWAFRGLVVNEYDSGKYSENSGKYDPTTGKNLTKGELILAQSGFIDNEGGTYTYEWAYYSILFSLLMSIAAVALTSVALVKVRFATGKSLANDSIEEEEDKDKEVSQVKTQIPFQKVDLTFKDMHYTVISSIGKEKIELLKGIDGVVAAGKMTALVSWYQFTKNTLLFIFENLVFRCSFLTDNFSKIYYIFLDGFFWCW